MPYAPSKIPLKDGLELAASNTGSTPEKLEKLQKLKLDFRKALQLGDIRAEGRILVDDSGRDDDNWSPVIPIPREFFDDNEGRDYIRWLVEMFGTVDKAPEEYFRPTREVVPGFCGSRLYDEEDGEPASRLGAITEAGRAELGALGRPDFENNSTGDPGPPHQNPRRAIEIQVLCEDVEKCFPVQSPETAQVADKKAVRASLGWGKWKRPVYQFLEEWFARDPESFPKGSREAAAAIQKEWGHGQGDSPSEKTIKEWIRTGTDRGEKKGNILKLVRAEAAQKKRI